ncbi:uncharacterized protein LOC135685632 [Rhopilema esculentum]|uniref:uncharacterized protein LOC135685632 n=1 Tax=Rhopilema esculentum TaxID=499914 RepID=UPI0031DAB59E
MSNQTFTTASSQGAIQKRSIIDVLQELQRQIQAYGQGPFTPEQAKEVEKLKILYVKAKQQYDKQLSLLQSSSMASSQATMQAALTGTTQLSVASTQGVGLTAVQSPQQVIKNQPQNITYQLQRTQGTAANLVATQSIINAHMLGQQNVQLVASNAGIVVSQAVAVVSGVSGNTSKNPIINVAATKQPMIARTQQQIRPTSSAVNIINHPGTANGASLVQQAQLRMLGINAGNGQTMSAGIQHGLAPVKPPSTNTAVPAAQSTQILNRKKVQDLLREIDPRETMDDDVEELLLQIADDFIENVVNSACQLAKHRKSNTLEAKDIQLHLDRHWNMWLPGFGNDDLRPHKKLAPAEAHRQRLAIIKKSLKK